MPGGYLLTLQFFLTLLLFLAYNAFFVQHQGRYLFSALIPIALVFAVGVLRFTICFRFRDVSLFLLVVVILIIAHGVLSSDFKGWPILITSGFAIILLTVSVLPDMYRLLAFGILFGLLYLLNFHAIFQRILPGLS